MKRYLLIKIGGSDIMTGLITKALHDIVYFGEEEEHPRSSNIGTMIMLNFLSEASIDELFFALKDIAVSNFFITEIVEEGFRANLNDRINENMLLNRFKHTTEKTIDEMNEVELLNELKYAEESQMFERCSKIKDKLDKVNSK